MSAAGAFHPQGHQPAAMHRWRRGVRLLNAMVLAVVVLFCGVMPVEAGAEAVGTTTSAPTSPNPLERLRPLLKPSSPSGLLQEVAAPVAVQQIQEALADRQPQVTIEAPSDGANLPSGSWTLKLNVQDWPLHDAGALGIGPHVVIQVDDQDPIRLSERRSGPRGDAVQINLPALTPGSHRITAYAATPWGEAARNPGAVSQIRVHRVAANPLTLPEAGSPQVLGVSPMGTVAGEPVLLDWLLLDAPLQHLRDNDGSWRLRIAINDERFVVDQNTPLWLKGWKTGSNSLQLELVDGRGKPLNPPFNSLVSEVVLQPSASQPRWQQGRLSPTELANLLGQTPPPAVTSKPPAVAAKRAAERSEQPPAPVAEAPVAEAPAVHQSENPGQGQPAVLPKPAATQAPINVTPANPSAAVEEPPEEQPEVEEPEVEQPQVEGPEAPIGQQPVGDHPAENDPTEIDPTEDASRQETTTTDAPAVDAPATDSPAADAPPEGVAANPGPAEQEPTAASELPTPAEPINNGGAAASAAASTDTVGQPQPIEQGPDGPESAIKTAGAASPKVIANPDRISPSSNVAGSARDQVREDGSLIKPKREGFFGGLLDRLGA